MLRAFARSIEDAEFLVAAVLLVMFALGETFRPLWRLRDPPFRRWSANLALFIGDFVLLGILVPSNLIGAFIGRASDRPLAMLARIGGEWPVLIVGFLAMDAFLYAAHVLEHRVFAFWRIHVVHHSDTALDIGTAVRHHPAEPLFHTLVGSAIFIALGMPVWVGTLYGLVSIAFGYAQHANIRILTPRADRALQAVFMTPDLHRVHHSIVPIEHDSNYGNVLSVWDHLFGTYRAMSVEELARLRFGVDGLLAPREAWPDRVLLQPFTIRRSP